MESEVPALAANRHPRTHMSDRVIVAFLAGLISGFLLLGIAAGKVHDANEAYWREIAERSLDREAQWEQAWRQTDAMLGQQIEMWRGEPRWTVLADYGPGGSQ